MRKYIPPGELPFSTENYGVKLYCPKCGKVAGKFSESQKYIYIQHPGGDTCYQRNLRGKADGKS